MDSTVISVGAALLYATAGLCVFLIALNRYLLLLPDSRTKSPCIAASFALLVGGSMAAACVLPPVPWVLVPIALLGLVLVGEIRRMVIRRTCAGTAAVGTLPHRVDLARPVTTTQYVVHRFEVAHPKWDGVPFRVAHLTDLHVDAALPLEYYRQVIAAAEEARPDLAVFTGDFVTRRSALPKLRDVLRPIARFETCAVLGNHDYWVGADAVRRVIRECGLRLLSGETARLAIHDRPVAVTGCDHPWGTAQQRLVPPDEAALHLVLSHTPDNIYRISMSSGDIVFSGHYHAGQIRIPLLGSVVIPSVYGRRFDHGHFVVNGTHLFVAAGIGAARPALRMFCRPDVFLVDILPAAAVLP